MLLVRLMKGFIISLDLNLVALIEFLIVNIIFFLKILAKMKIM
jgi:hypothetical protein